MSIVKECQYTLKPESVRVKRYQRILPSLANNPNTGYSMGDSIIYYLPGGLPNTLADGKTAYLRFTLNVQYATDATGVNANAQAVAFDYTASSIIRRLDIYGPGGALISSLDRYNTLMTGIYDVSHSQSELIGLSTLVGCGGGNTTTALNRLGYSMTGPAANMAGNAAATNSQWVFTVPLVAPIFSGADKYIPLFACSDDFRIEVQLDTQAAAFVIPTVAHVTPTCTIRNPVIIIDFLEMEPAATAQIASLYSGRDLVLHCEDWHNYETTILNGTTGAYSTILPSKVMSAKSALMAWRRLAVTGVAAGYTQSARTNPFTGASSTLNLSVGGERVPQRPITTNVAGDVSEHFAELQKSFHALNHVEFSGTLPIGCYTSDEDVAVGDLPSVRGYIAGINLDKLQGQSDVLLSGTDLSKVTTYIEADFTTAITGDQTMDTFIRHDSLLVISPEGVCVSKW